MCPDRPERDSRTASSASQSNKNLGKLNYTTKCDASHSTNRVIISTLSCLASYIIKHYYKHITSYFLTPGDEGEGRQRRSPDSQLVNRQDQVIDLIGHVMLHTLSALLALNYHFSQLNNQNYNFVDLINYNFS